MKGFVFHGPGRTTWEEVPDPVVEEPTDAVVRVDTVTICGTDLHILKGDVPEVAPGTVLGHEAVGEVVETGAAVRTLRPGDRVLVSCITSCGRCAYCRRGRYGQCRGGGGRLLGHLTHGTQAEYVRVPHADLTGGLGADVAVEAVGVPESFELCARVVRPGGPHGGGVRRLRPRRRHRRPQGRAEHPPPGPGPPAEPLNPRPELS